MSDNISNIRATLTAVENGITLDALTLDLTKDALDALEQDIRDAREEYEEALTELEDEKQSAEDRADELDWELEDLRSDKESADERVEELEELTEQQHDRITELARDLHDALRSVRVMVKCDTWHLTGTCGATLHELLQKYPNPLDGEDNK